MALFLSRYLAFRAWSSRPAGRLPVSMRGKIELLRLVLEWIRYPLGLVVSSGQKHLELRTQTLRRAPSNFMELILV
jgi:hypothetical protein